MIDTTKPVEAVNLMDGRVVPMTIEFVGSDGIITREAPCRDTGNVYWYKDGTDKCSHNKWLLRNVVEDVRPKTEKASPSTRLRIREHQEHALKLVPLFTFNGVFDAEQARKAMSFVKFED